MMSRFYALCVLFLPLLPLTGPGCVFADDDQAQPPQPLSEVVAVYGHSVRGRPLIAVTLGTGGNVTLILGGIHGNEPGAPELVEEFKAYLEKHPEELAGNAVVLVAHVNPDGDLANTRGNADGVDLNRNFPEDWMPRRRGIALSPGSAPLSEPESAALVQLLNSVEPSKVVSLHQPFNCLLPSGPGGDILADKMSAASQYKVLADVGYPTPGSFGSYCYRVHHIAAVTLELPRYGVAGDWARNKWALLCAIDCPPASVAE